MSPTPQPMKLPAAIVAFAALCIGSFAQAQTPAPHINPADDKNHFGPPDKILFWTPQQQVAGFRNINRIFPTRKINAGNKPLKLPNSLRDIGGIQIRVRDRTVTVDEFVQTQSVGGMLVIKDGEIVYEYYGLGNDQDTLWVSFSVAKSVTSMLVGAAIQDGYIKSVDEPATDYLTRLKGTPYDQSTIADILQMSSGVQWDEDYADPNSDVNTATWGTLDLYEYLRQKPRAFAPGEVFNYNTAETNLAGTLLRSAIGNNLATYLTEKIWRPFGMQADANWMLTEFGGGEAGGCCISATLRDYGRLGLFAMANGRLADGTAVLPENWISESMQPSRGYAGYGYLWWLLEDDTFAASGIFGQGIYVNPQAKVVIALHSALPRASVTEDKALRYAMYAAVAAALED